MAAYRSPYAVLGLEPGADSAAVDNAYKRLIKRYHPDHEGGDGQRAAEIIHAYRELRSSRNALVLVDEEPEGTGLPAWVRAALLTVAGASALLIGGATYLGGPQTGAGPRSAASAAAASADPMKQPLELDAVDAAIREAMHMARTQDEMALAGVSRDCHDKLRNEPSVLQLDRCAAFDNAVVQLQDRDPLRDHGPFSELSVTRRQWSAASALSHDYLAIDSRLDRIRLRVELALAPGMQERVKAAAAD